MTDRTPLIDKRFASRVDWNLMRTFVEIVRAGGIVCENTLRRIHSKD